MWGFHNCKVSPTSTKNKIKQLQQCLLVYLILRHVTWSASRTTYVPSYFFYSLWSCLSSQKNLIFRRFKTLAHLYFVFSLEVRTQMPVFIQHKATCKFSIMSFCASYIMWNTRLCQKHVKIHITIFPVRVVCWSHCQFSDNSVNVILFIKALFKTTAVDQCAVQLRNTIRQVNYFK